ncbi:MAG: ATP-binding protein [Thermodesulfovibrionales bacterium]|nr:ATP-binding protein [Thermodesulfovibrionales bacterium]
MVSKLRFRLSLYWTLATIVLLLTLSSVILIQHKKDLLKSIDNKLMEEAKKALSDFERTKIVKDVELIRKKGNEYFYIINKGSSYTISALNVISYGLPFNEILLAKAFTGKFGFETVQFNNEKLRVLYFPLNSDNVTRHSLSLSPVDEDVKRLQSNLIIFLPFVSFFSLTIGWLISKIAVSPINKISAATEEILNENPNKRINLKLNVEEYNRLICQLNKIFERDQKLSETQKLFAYNVSHEIRSPLTSLRGNIEVALRKKRDAQEYEEVLKNCLFDVIRLSKITDNLLFLAKADKNILHLRKQHIDIKKIFMTVIENLSEKIQTKELKIVESYQGNLELYCDIDMLEQAFTNIIENAIKYSPSGGVVTIKAWQEESLIKTSITDTGVGIPKKDLPYIFERFYRARQDNTLKDNGIGLGLAIAKWVIDSHQGNITVKSELNKGSEFLITLPKTFH